MSLAPPKQNNTGKTSTSSARGIIIDQPRSSSMRMSTSSRSTIDVSISGVGEHHQHMPNLAVLAALHAMKVETAIGFSVLNSTDHLFLMRTTSRPPHLPGYITRSTGLQVYEVINQTGHRLFFAVVLPKQCLGMCWVCPNSFEALIVDSFGDELFKIEADSGSFGRGSVTVAKSKNEVFGRIRQEGDWCTPDYTLTSAADDPLLKIRPAESVNCFNCCVPVDYVIYHGELANRVGKMNTKWYNTGVLPEVFYSPNIKLYGVQFPTDLDISSKVLLLSALLMVKIFRNEF